MVYPPKGDSSAIYIVGNFNNLLTIVDKVSTYIRATLDELSLTNFNDRISSI